ncbi:MAG: hypothetical protein GF344_01480 [Chitinivibrionales bacterium]|nr:hypothetical protein [Chitinivibrionales bacterium]
MLESRKVVSGFRCFSFSCCRWFLLFEGGGWDSMRGRIAEECAKRTAAILERLPACPAVAEGEGGTECPGREAASLHKPPYVDMRYNSINSIFRACAQPGTAQRTHKDVYVKVREPDATERLAVGRGAREGSTSLLKRKFTMNRIDESLYSLDEE